MYSFHFENYLVLVIVPVSAVNSFHIVISYSAFSASTLLVGCQEERPACKN